MPQREELLRPGLLRSPQGLRSGLCPSGLRSGSLCPSGLRSGSLCPSGLRSGLRLRVRPEVPPPHGRLEGQAGFPQRLRPGLLRGSQGLCSSQVLRPGLLQVIECTRGLRTFTIKPESSPLR